MKWFVFSLLTFVLGALVVNVLHNSYMMSFQDEPGAAYRHFWKCDEDKCLLLIDTPHGPMFYMVPPKIRGQQTLYHKV